MRILIAPDKFKCCLSATQVVEAIVGGLRQADPSIEVERCPVADGGEGTVSALVSATGGRLIQTNVTGPRVEMKVDATFGFLGDRETAVIEMAEASGLHLLRTEQRDPLQTTTFGTGELMNCAEQMGARRLILGIGGSATCDAGLGCAHARGVPILLGGAGLSISQPPLRGRDVERVTGVEGHADNARPISIVVACDVTNPLFGPNGAACVYGPQKGATPEVVQRLDQAMERLATRLGQVELANQPGAGAAGGLGFGLQAFCGATLQSGFELVADVLNLRRRIATANLVITGEGKLDSQSLSGKAAYGVAMLCQELNRPCIAIAGVAEDRPAVFSHVYSVRDHATSDDESMTHAAALIRQVVANNLNNWR